MIFVCGESPFNLSLMKAGSGCVTASARERREVGSRARGISSLERAEFGAGGVTTVPFFVYKSVTFYLDARLGKYFTVEKVVG